MPWSASALHLLRCQERHGVVFLRLWRMVCKRRISQEDYTCSPSYHTLFHRRSLGKTISHPRLSTKRANPIFSHNHRTSFNMSSILYEKDFTKLESSIHESTYKLFMHMAWMDMCIDNGMMELELRTRAMKKARDEMQALGECLPDLAEEDVTTDDRKSKPLASLDVCETTSELIMRTIRCLEAGAMTKCIAALTCAALIAPVTAIDDRLVLGRTFAVPDMDVHPVPTIAIGTLTSMLFLCGGHLMGTARGLIGPLMGITSVLYFMMRNDAAVEPIIAWGVLGAWSVFTLMYLNFQCRRVTYDKIYMLMSLVFAGLCLCVVALVQQSAIQGGLVTAIPPCTSFAAYAVAFLFPDRPIRAQYLDVV
ncbi:hypothetical protein DPSP01_004000 [Paraphaeosphaeria sporulosa]